MKSTHFSVFFCFAVLLLGLPLSGLCQKSGSGGGFGGGMGGAGGFVLRERMKRDRPADFQLLSKVKKSEIVVVRGVYDHVETVLDYVKVPYALIEADDLERAELNAGQLLLINCPGNLTPAGVEKVRKFVWAGGFLFTTDWSLLNVLEKAFPGYVKYNQKPSKDDVVEVRVLQKDNHFLQHVSSGRGTPKWWLEGQSYPIQVVDPAKVKVLMASAEMKTKYGEAPIAVHFRYGDGQVLHIVSHYYLQRTETRTAADKQKGTEFAKDLNIKLPAASKAALEKITAGEARDAYSASQLSANVIVAKQKMNVQLQQIYRHRNAAPDTLRKAADANSPAVKKIDKGTLLKVLEKRGDWWSVQTYSGDVGWIPSKNVK